MPTRKLLMLLAFCVALALAVPATSLANPTARYLLLPSSPLAGQVTTFDASPTSCDLRPCTYRWSRVLRSTKSRRVQRLGRGKVLRHTFKRSGVRYLRLTVRNRKGQKSSRTRRIVVSNAPTPIPAPTPLSAEVNLEEVDGGLGWYGRFSHPFPTDPAFFPVGVWFESVVSQADINLDKAAGLNTYVVLTGNSSLPLIAANGMKVLAQHGDWESQGAAPGAQAIAGWELRDEIDMQLGPVQGFAELQNILAGLPADGRAPLQQLRQRRDVLGDRRGGGAVRQRPGPCVGRHVLVHGQQHLLAK